MNKSSSLLLQLYLPLLHFLIMNKSSYFTKKKKKKEKRKKEKKKDKRLNFQKKKNQFFLNLSQKKQKKERNDNFTLEICILILVIRSLISFHQNDLNIVTIKSTGHEP